MGTKSIQQVTAPQEFHWVGDGFHVTNFIPSVPGLSMRDMDPFILMDYNPPYTFAPTDHPGGVGLHPHRGFETVTIVYKGSVEHGDSNGNSGVIYDGDVQWMTAASGVLHREHHEKMWASKGGIFHMVQLWVNLPSKDKMSAPTYQSISQREIPRHPLPDGSYIEVIAGQYNDTKGKAITHSPIHLMNAHLVEGGEAEFSFPKDYNTALVVVSGQVHINGQTRVSSDHFVKLSHDGETFHLRADVPSIVLVLSGEPLNEPIAAHGPFVMNTKSEILQAFRDVEEGRFGTLA